MLAHLERTNVPEEKAQRAKQLADRLFAIHFREEGAEDFLSRLSPLFESSFDDVEVEEPAEGVEKQHFFAKLLSGLPHR